MKVKVPLQIPVGGHSFAILFDRELEDSNQHGLVNFRLLQIRINPLRPPSQQVEALIHEVLHIVAVVYANNSLGEEVVDSTSEGLLQVFNHFDVELDWSDIPMRTATLLDLPKAEELLQPIPPPPPTA